ncbi:hypothetical protein IFM89_030959 [Coptis chinensis]|uniref:Uncharacterized protein n=1 Tax=Coptis chinensis TaxID=261450 RepID=A0A835J0P5_9MAGN|nr:hypothetical protein IFM89_030959 [Coptis chinensis]
MCSNLAKVGIEPKAYMVLHQTIVPTPKCTMDILFQRWEFGVLFAIMWGTWGATKGIFRLPVASRDSGLLKNHGSFSVTPKVAGTSSVLIRKCGLPIPCHQALITVASMHPCRALVSAEKFISFQVKRKTSKLKMLSDYDTQEPSHIPKQCGSVVVQNIDAPLVLVWSIVRQFGKPQAYKKFVKSCCMIRGNEGVGSVRELKLVSGLPAHWSIERLDKLDDKLHVIEFSIIGGDHRLTDYHSTLTLHEIEDEPRNTVVMESYTVHVPDGNTEEDTCSFVDTIIRCNLQSLSRVAEKMDVNYSVMI